LTEDVVGVGQNRQGPVAETIQSSIRGGQPGVPVGPPVGHTRHERIDLLAVAGIAQPTAPSVEPAAHPVGDLRLSQVRVGSDIAAGVGQRLVETDVVE
jgi:hypothetical protein